jgi:predicted nucleic acid-binding Zn finger protein
MGTSTIEYSVHNQRVTCRHDTSNHRKWHCDCPDFARRAETYGDGFCAHVVCAIQAALARGDIEIAFPAPEV